MPTYLYGGELTADRTGSTGHIGSSILELLAKTHPDLPATAIPRDVPCGYAVIEERAANSDIVIRTSPSAHQTV